MPKNFCALPFHHTAIQTDGTYNICCQHKVPSEHALNIKTSKHIKWFQSDYVKNVQDSFLSDQRHPGCSSCWGHDDHNLTSMRQRVMKEYTILGIDTERPNVKYIEVNLGNLCNLKCLMCNEKESSAILAENIRLGINIQSQENFKWDDQAFTHLEQIIHQQPKVLNIRGGEPFYNKALLSLVRNIPDHQARQMMLHITTNATIWDDSWKDALSRFRLVRIMFSVDAVDDLYEYIRFPATWTTVRDNIQEINKCKNVISIIHCVVQNLNIGKLEPLIEWSMQVGIHLELDMLWAPMYLHITNLPSALKIEVLQNLKTLLDKQYPDHVMVFLKKCHQVLNESMSQTDNVMWNTFKQQIVPRDQLRENSYTKFLKEIS
jgi:hypothetical protein